MNYDMVKDILQQSELNNNFLELFSPRQGETKTSSMD